MMIHSTHEMTEEFSDSDFDVMYGDYGLGKYCIECGAITVETASRTYTDDELADPCALNLRS